MIEAGPFKLEEDKYNISPFGKTGAEAHHSAMSASAIAAVCNCSRSQVLNILKDIYYRVVETANADKSKVCLDVKIGTLTIDGQEKKVKFENYDESTAEERRQKQREEAADALRHALTDPLTKRKTNIKVSSMLNSSALSTMTGGSCFVSVKTPNTIANSTASSIAKQKNKYSLFKQKEDDEEAKSAYSHNTSRVGGLSHLRRQRFKRSKPLNLFQGSQISKSAS